MDNNTLSAIVNIGQLLAISTDGFKSPYRKGGMQKLDIIEKAAIIIENGVISKVGVQEDFEDDLKNIENKIDANGNLVTPGFIDSHTHPVFYGTREKEYGMRIRGASYNEIAKAGGGILNTMKRVRAASIDDMVENSLYYLDTFVETGVTTIEAKSGYGLSPESEIAQLEAIKRLNEIHSLDLIPTFMGAHEVPEEYRNGMKQDYIKLLCKKMIPEVARKKLAVYNDVFCEEGVYTPEETEQILLCGEKYGLKSRFHADEIVSTGGAELAAKLNVKSADHLGAITQAGIEALANSNTVATLLPGTVLFLNLKQFAPARELIDNGAIVALSTDFNPGSSPTTNLPLIMTLACSRMRMTPDEAWAAVTVNAAYSLDIQNKVGFVAPGYNADLVVWNASNYELIPYNYGINRVELVIKKGKIIHEKS